MATDVSLILNYISSQCRRNLDTTFGMKTTPLCSGCLQLGHYYVLCFFTFLMPHLSQQVLSQWDMLADPLPRDLWWLPGNSGTVSAARVQLLLEKLCEERPELLHAAHSHSQPSPMDQWWTQLSLSTKWVVPLGEWVKILYTVRSELKKDGKHPSSHQGQRRRKGR